MLLTELGLILLLVVANGVFAGAEIAVISLRSTRIEELAQRHRRSARAVRALRANPERFLATVQVGITVVGATAAAFGGASIAAPLAELLEEIDWLGKHAQGIAIAIVVASISYLSIVVGELVPKSLALRSAETYALVFARPLLALSKLATPLVWLLSASANVLLKPFGDRTTFVETRHSVGELRELVDEASQAGTIPPAAGEIAARALELSDLTVADVMVPRQSVVMISTKASRDELRRVMLEHGYSRYPVHDGNPDNVIGYVTVKDVLALAWERDLIVLADLVRPPYFVPDSKGAAELINDMRARHVPFGIVVDEHGGLAGIVTLEDLVEELVGEIFTEHPRHEPGTIRRDPDGSAVVDGTTPIRDLNRELDLELPEDGDWNTIAGLCLALAGRVPNAGQTFSLENGTKLEIVDATPKRIRTVRIRMPPPVA